MCQKFNLLLTNFKILIKKSKMSTSDTIIELEDLEKIDIPLETPYRRLNRYIMTDMEEEEKDVIKFGEHSFMQGMLQAFMNHKSITLSPDIIWILILQGFSYHVAQNKDNLRSMFVSFEGKKELTVKRTDLTPATATKADWMSIIDDFVDQIGENTGKQLTDTLEPKFSTTTKISHTAGMVSIMSAMQHYFDYRVIMCSCGFPSITIEGTVEDWEAIKRKVEDIAKYDLQWWTSKLTPIIDEFINAKKGIINKQFWLNTLRRKPSRGPYRPGYIDGWLCTFFPYDKYGERKSLKALSDNVSDLPSEILKAPFILELHNVGEFNCEFHSGFFGVKETKKEPGVYNVKPIIGWGIMFNVPKKEKPKPRRNDMFW